MSTRYQLIEEILHSFHAIRNIIKAKAAGHNKQNHVTHTRWFVLTMIEHLEESNVKQISQAMEISSSAATQLVDSLVRRGYVIRREDPKDRRSVRLKISPKGRKYITGTKRKRIAEMADLFDALTDNELEEFSRLHKKIASSYSHKKSFTKSHG